MSLRRQHLAVVGLFAATLACGADASAQMAGAPSQSTQPVPATSPAAPAVVARQQGMPAPAAAPDPRIRYRAYSPDTIYKLFGHTGYQIMVQLEPDDRVQTVAIGDASGWQITPNEARNLLFLKPLRVSGRTNMSIVTDRRTYNFELVAFNGAHARPIELTYVLRFQYPQSLQATQSTQADLPVLGSGPFNRAYSFEGSDLNVPAQVFDDGKATYFRFAEGTARPAIFVVEPGAGESIVNVAHRGPYTVVDRVAATFVLKQGREVTRLFNDGFAPPVLGEDAPQRRAKSRKRGRP
jgi:type IV secretion system protein VirB9